MNKRISAPLLASLLIASIAVPQAEEKLQPEQLQKIESLQRRADKLTFGEPGAYNYHLAKARTWLDLALSEYRVNDADVIIVSAIFQAESLLDALEKKQTSIRMDTPILIEGSEAVRPDLWRKIFALKRDTHFSCGQRPVAEAEVPLVWAGHEKHKPIWEHAEPHVRSAERLLKEASNAINECFTRIPAIEKIALSSDALFQFGNAGLEPSALGRLNTLFENIRALKTLDEIKLAGHTDRLRSDGRQERNQILSEQRAESIKKYLAGKGIPDDKIHASGTGSSQPLVQCPSDQSKAMQVECLKPNRRVEIILRGSR